MLPPSKHPRRGSKADGKAAGKKVSKAKAKPFKPPADWKAIYALVEELRQDRTAPCDHSGAEALAALLARHK